MKSFSTVRDTQRGTQSYMEEKKEEGDRGDQEEQRGNQKGESKLASNRFPVCSPQSGPLREVDGVTQRGEAGGRGKGTEVAGRIKGGIRRRETGPASNQFPKCSPQPGTHKEIHRVG